MSAAVLNIEFSRNEDWSRGFTLMDQNDPPAPIDLTGATFDFDIRYTHNSAGEPLVDVPITCPAPATGYFEFTLFGANFADIGSMGSNSRFVYDIVATQDGKRISLISGEILLTPGVSNNEA